MMRHSPKTLRQKIPIFLFRGTKESDLGEPKYVWGILIIFFTAFLASLQFWHQFHGILQHHTGLNLWEKPIYSSQRSWEKRTFGARDCGKIQDSKGLKRGFLHLNWHKFWAYTQAVHAGHRCMKHRKSFENWNMI